MNIYKADTSLDYSKQVLKSLELAASGAAAADLAAGERCLKAAAGLPHGAKEQAFVHAALAGAFVLNRAA